MSPSVNLDMEVREETLGSLDSRMAKMLLDYHCRRRALRAERASRGIYRQARTRASIFAIASARK